MNFMQTPKGKSVPGFRKAKMGDQETNIATIQSDIKYIQRDVGEIKQTIKEFTNATVSRAEFDKYCKENEEKMKEKASKEEFDFYKRMVNFIAGAVTIEAIRLAFSYFHK